MTIISPCFSEAPKQSKIGRPTKETPQILGFVTQATLTNPCISGSDLQDQINEKVINFYAPQSKEELIRAIKYAWDSIFFDTINKLCNFFLQKMLRLPSKSREMY